MKNFLLIILTLIIVVLTFAFNGLVFWGLGVAFVKAFNINFAFTYWQGLIIGTIFSLICMSLKKQSIN